jgi:tryptophanase
MDREAGHPRRVYTQSHIDYVAEGVLRWPPQARRAVRIVSALRMLRHFTAKFEPI